LPGCRGHVLDAKVIDLTTNSDVIEIPITPDMAPNAFVSVVIVKGVDQNELVPSFKMGYAAFTVNRDQQILTVTLTPAPPPLGTGGNYAPRTPVSYTLKVLDFQGKPVQAEVSLALVDLSVLTLLDPFALPMPDFYYSERVLSVMTSASTNRNPRCWRSRMSSTSSAVSTTPTASGMPKSRCSAIADPMTSARSHAAMAISHRTQWKMTAGRE
jgi:hypothetical protein